MSLYFTDDILIARPDTEPNVNLGAQGQRRIGKRKAAVAVGHSILVICWHLLANDGDYEDLGGDWFARRTDTDKRRDHLIRQLQNLGYGVTLTNIAA